MEHACFNSVVYAQCNLEAILLSIGHHLVEGQLKQAAAHTLGSTLSFGADCDVIFKA